MDMEKRLTDQDVIKLYGISKRTLERWVQEGFIPVIKITKKVRRYIPSELEKWEKKLSQKGRISPRLSLEEVGVGS